MTTLSDLLKTNITITTLIEFADNDDDIIPDYQFEIGECTIESCYELDDAVIRLQASGIFGETANGQIVSVTPSTQFDDFCLVHFSNVDNVMSGTFYLNEMGEVFDKLAKEYPNKDLHPLANAINKMATNLFKMSFNAKLLNKHPKEVRRPLPF